MGDRAAPLGREFLKCVKDFVETSTYPQFLPHDCPHLIIDLSRMCYGRGVKWRPDL